MICYSVSVAFISAHLYTVPLPASLSDSAFSGHSVSSYSRLTRFSSSSVKKKVFSVFFFCFFFLLFFLSFDESNTACCYKKTQRGRFQGLAEEGGGSTEENREFVCLISQKKSIELPHGNEVIWVHMGGSNETLEPPLNQPLEAAIFYSTEHHVFQKPSQNFSYCSNRKMIVNQEILKRINPYLTNGFSHHYH